MLALLPLEATASAGERSDLLETAVVLDLLALCHPPGGYLPRPYQEEPGGPDKADELRTDASDAASGLALHDLQHGTSVTGDIPPALKDGCTEDSAMQSAPTLVESGLPPRWP
ncbi:hypothetical protein [Streptomyces sp. 3N207]|uniref:hypothetical protein n=1 Tax=Streptomyces sp. 3N207 TaxID=3457417 RepID=UPI003FCF5572